MILIVLDWRESKVAIDDFYVTVHAKGRMAIRSITTNDIVNALHKGKKYQAKEDRITVVYKFLMLIIGVRYGKIAVVSVKYNKQFTRYAEQYSKDNNIGFYEAIRQIRLKGLEDDAKKMPIVYWNNYGKNKDVKLSV